MASNAQLRVTQAVSRGILQRQCTCGQHAPGGGTCDDCEKEKSTLQRSSVNAAAPSSVPPIVHQTLRSPGQPLDAGVRAVMEPKFGRNFSDVRVHTGRLAEQSAQSVSASAYTVGRRVVFAEGQYAPRTPRGRQLIAHELTHVVQQGGRDSLPASIGPSDDGCEREADRVSAEFDRPRFASGFSSAAPVVQREDGKKNPPPAPAPPQTPAAPPKGPTAPPQAAASAAPAGAVKGMKTSCDVKIDPNDMSKFVMGDSVHTIGTGQPQIGNLFPGLETTYPCLAEAGVAHEQEHVKTNAAACMAFKKCVDAHSGKYLGIFGTPEISHDDFVRCHNDNHNGMTADCIGDEKNAYEVMIVKARALMLEARCAKEKALLQKNITYWESIKDHDPDCPPQK